MLGILPSIWIDGREKLILKVVGGKTCALEM